MKKARNLVAAETNLIRKMIEQNLELGKSHEDIIQQLGISRATYDRHLKRIQKEMEKIWDKIYIDSAKYRATQLMDCFNNCIRVCKEILADAKAKHSDKLEASRTLCEAQANILKLVDDGPTFRPSLRLPYPTYNQESLSNNTSK
jgi:IS30 family transposase